MLDFNIDKWIERIKEEERVRCPYCDYSLSDSICMYELYEIGVPVTYHGWLDERDSTIECPECEETFKIREHVRRTYDTCKINEEID